MAAKTVSDSSGIKSSALCWLLVLISFSVLFQIVCIRIAFVVVAIDQAQLGIVVPKTQLAVTSSICVPVGNWGHPLREGWAALDVLCERWLRHDCGCG